MKRAYHRALNLDNRAGGGGDLFGANNDDGRTFTMISELWVQRDYSISSYYKVGLIDAAADFQASNNAGEFLNSVFGVIPNLPVPTFPDYAFGVVAGARLSQSAYGRLGVMDGAMEDTISKAETAFDQTFYAVEIGYAPHATDEDKPHGTYKIGMFKHTGNIPDGYDGAAHSHNYGLYFVADQPLSPKTGLFLQFGDTPDDRNYISRYWGAGLAFNSFLKSRPEDAAGIAFGTGRISSHQREQGAGSGESVLEIYYKAHLYSALSLMPDLQWIGSPGGNGKNNLLYGVKVQYAF